MERRLEHRLEYLAHGLTDHPVGHVRDSQPSLPAPCLRDLHPARRTRPITPIQQGGGQLRTSNRPLLNSSPTVNPSGPGAPLFDTTFNSAADKRLTTSSIVTGVTLSTLTIASGTLALASANWSTDASRAAPFGFSAVAIGRRSCPAVCSTGIAFPCEPGLDPARSAGITPPSSSTRSSDFCRAISLRSFTLGHTGLPAGTRQISWGKTLRFRRDHVANTPSGPTGTGHRCWRPAHPPKGRLTALHSRSRPRRIYGFLQTRPHGSPRSANPAALGTARSIPGRALASSMSGSPCQGPGSGLPPPISNVMPSTPLRSPSGRPPLRAHRVSNQGQAATETPDARSLAEPPYHPHIQHANLGITSIYLQGIDTREIVDTVHHRRPPVIPASAGLRP